MKFLNKTIYLYFPNDWIVSQNSINSIKVKFPFGPYPTLDCHLDCFDNPKLNSDNKIRDYILDQEEYLKIVWSIIKNSSFNYKKVIPLLCISKQDLKKISNLGHHIGLHSHTHPTNIARLNSDEQHKEYTENKYVLESIIKKNVISVAHPVNSYNSKTLQILSSLNIKFGFCSNQGAVKNRSNLELPRIDHSEIIKVLSK